MQITEVSRVKTPNHNTIGKKKKYVEKHLIIQTEDKITVEHLQMMELSQVPMPFEQGYCWNLTKKKEQILCGLTNYVKVCQLSLATIHAHVFTRMYNNGPHLFIAVSMVTMIIRLEVFTQKWKT